MPSGDAGRIYPGDRICYGGTGTVSAGQSTTSGGGTYTVKSGDCLSAVFGSRWPSIAALNGLVSPYTIYPGQVLKTDGGATTSASGGSRTVTASACRRGPVPTSCPHLAHIFWKTRVNPGKPE